MDKNHAFRPKKSLGQNFLKSKEALRTMLETADINSNDLVVEVGPGKGALTELLLPASGKVIAIEKDSRLIPLLKEKYTREIGSKKLEIMEQDILEFDGENLNKIEDYDTYKLVANIPYYITGALIRKFLSGKFQPTKMVLLLQKEVAERIAARDKKESLLSISVKAYGRPKYIKTVKAKYFSPAPTVDSAILLIEDISKDNFKNISEELFFTVTRSGFAHKRKKVMSNLLAVFPDKQHLENIFSELSLNKNARPEDLGIDAWLALAKAYIDVPVIGVTNPKFGME